MSRVDPHKNYLGRLIYLQRQCFILGVQYCVVFGFLSWSLIVVVYVYWVKVFKENYFLCACVIASNRTSPYVISGKLRNKYVLVHVFTPLFYNVYDIELIYLDFGLEIGNVDIKNAPPILSSHNLR